MTIQEINPYVRFARWQEANFPKWERIAYDQRLFIVEKGNVTFYVGDQVYKAEKGDVIFWRAGIRYRVEAAPGAVISGCNFDFVRTEHTVLPPVFPANMDQYTGEVLETVDFSDTRMFDSVLFLRHSYGIQPKLHKLYEEYESKLIFYEHRCSALLKDELILCLRFSGGSWEGPSGQITQAVLDHIRQHYREDLTNAHFERVFHYHPNYISQLVKSSTGLPLHRYIRTYRVHAALDLLQSTELSVAEIAEQVGIRDIHQFSKTFKQIIGSSPSSFRK